MAAQRRALQSTFGPAAQLKCEKCEAESQEEAQVQLKAASGSHGAGVVQLANCYFFKNADCQGKRIRAQSKHNFSDYATYNCSGERGGGDCVENDGKGECFCPNEETSDDEAEDRTDKNKPLSAFDDPSTSRFSRDLIARGLASGTYPPKF